MIKVSVMYPNPPGAFFDHEYYRDRHMPLVKMRMGDYCKYYTVDMGLAGGTPGVPPTYIAMATSSAIRSRHFRPALDLMRRRSWGIFQTTPTRFQSYKLAKSSWVASLMASECPLLAQSVGN
jgi:uncharacterized protein (TIGR02118 family)